MAVRPEESGKMLMICEENILEGDFRSQLCFVGGWLASTSDDCRFKWLLTRMFFFNEIIYLYHYGTKIEPLDVIQTSAMAVLSRGHVCVGRTRYIRDSCQS